MRTLDPAVPARTSTTPGGPARTLFRLVVGSLAILVGVLFVGVTALTLAVWMLDPSTDETNPVVDLGFFALGGVLVGVGLASQLRAPERSPAGLQQALLGLGALTVAGFLGDRVEPLWAGFVLTLLTAAAAVLHPLRAELVRWPVRPIGPLVGLGLVATVPAALYAATMLGLALEAGPSCFAGQCARGDRFAEMAALAAAIVLVTLLAGAGPRGWRLSARCAGIAAGIVGIASVLLPEVAGSLGLLGGGAAVVWALLVVAGARSGAGTS